MSAITLKINATPISNINSNFNEETTRMKNLDIGKITVINDTDSEAFNPDSQVEITIDGYSRKFILMQDNFKQVGKSPFTYEHELDLVEITKYLEGIQFPNRKYSQPLDATLLTGWTVWDILEDFRITAELKLGSDTNYLWTYDTSNIDGIGVNLQTYTDGILAKEITLNKPNAREGLDQILKQVGMECRMSDFGVVSVDLINHKNNAIDISDVIIYKGSHLLEQYADRIDMFVENAITENNLNKQAVVYPSQGWSSVRGSGSFLTSDDFIMEVSEPIEKILKFEVYVETTSTPIGGGTAVDTIQVDITELLSEKKEFETLAYNLAVGVGGYVDTVARNNSVYFTRGDTKILGWHEEIDKFTGFSGTYFSYRHFLSYAATKATAAIKYDSDFNDGYENFMFRLTYVPVQDERLRIERKTPQNTRTLLFNQPERIPDIEKLGDKLKQDIERVGNKKLVIGKTVDNYANVFEIGDYYNDYIVEKVVNSVDKGEIITVAHLSKGAQSIALDVGVNTEIRDTLVDKSKAVVRQELYNEYMEVDFTSNTNDTIIQQEGLERYIYTLSNSAPSQLHPVEMVWWINLDADVPNLLLQCKSVGTANVVKFDMGFDSPNIAGRQTEQVDGLWVSTYIEYADPNTKRVEEAYIEFVGSVTATGGTYAAAKTLSKYLPEKFGATVTEQYFRTLTNAFKFKKDTNEILKFTYQLSHFSLQDEIILGNKLCTNNALVTDRQDDVYLVTSSTPFPNREYLLSSDYSAKDKIVTTGPPAVGEVLLSIAHTTNYASITAPAGSVYWAIVNENDELYVAVNSLTEKTIYFNPRKQRS